MHNALYFTLAKSNLKKNRAIYLPYLLANVLIVSMYYILTSIRSMMQWNYLRDNKSGGF